MAMRSCKVCNAPLEEGIVFCPECGNRIDSAEAAAPAGTSDTQDAYINEPAPKAAEPFSRNIPPVPPANPAPMNGGYVPPVQNAPVNGGYVPPVQNAPMNGGYVPPMQNAPVNNGYYMPPYQYPTQQQPRKSAKDVLAIIGLIVGIASIVLCCLNIIDIFIAIAGLVLSIIGIRSRKKGCGIAGTICSGIGLISAIVFLCVGLIGLGIAEENGVDIDSYYTEDYDSYGDMYSDMYDDVYEGIYGDIYDDIDGYYE